MDRLQALNDNLQRLLKEDQIRKEVASCAIQLERAHDFLEV
jgi:hypothetical protein